MNGLHTFIKRDPTKLLSPRFVTIQKEGLSVNQEMELTDHHKESASP